MSAFSDGEAFNLTWGQAAQLDHLRRNGFDMPNALLSGVWHLQRPATPTEVERALNLLVARHEVLHTVYPDCPEYPRTEYVPTDRATQRVVVARPVLVERVTGGRDDLPALCRMALARWKPLSFEPDDPSPLRAQLVGTDRGIEAVVVAVSHQAVDLVGYDILRGEFLAALRTGDGTGLPPARQPRVQVELEASGQLRAANEAGIAHLRSVLRRAPLTFLATGRPRSCLRASSATALSWRLADDVTRIGRACRSSGPSVLSTLAMLSLAANTRERQVVLRSLHSRRQSLRGQPYVVPQNLAALVLLELPAQCSIKEAFELGRRAALLGYSHTDYDPMALVSLEHEAAKSRGTRLDGYCLFNFTGPATSPAASGARATGPTRESVLRSTGAVSIPLNMRFILACSFDPAGAVELDLQIDDELAGGSALAFVEGLQRFARFAAGNLTETVHDGFRAAGLGGGG